MVLPARVHTWPFTPTSTQALLAELLFAKPADPRQHIVAALEKAKVVGCKPLLDAGDLGAIFGMLDITQRGTVSQQQATSTLSTVIGSAALQQQQQQQQQRQQQQAASTGAAAASNLDKQQFVSYMHTALCAATPLCKVTQPSSHAVVLGEDV
jgi:hypothetical protein